MSCRMAPNMAWIFRRDPRPARWAKRVRKLHGVESRAYPTSPLVGSMNPVPSQPSKDVGRREACLSIIRWSRIRHSLCIPTYNDSHIQ
jgi:hypothetical protein